jgi:NitT/TauT family transport system substrate-binding protein
MLAAGHARAAGLRVLTISEPIHGMDSLPFYIAIRQGYFRDAGLDIKMITTEGGGRHIAAVLSGDADAYIGGPEHIAYAWVKGGQELRAVAGVSMRANVFLVPAMATQIAPGASFATAVKDKRVAVGTRGGTGYSILQYLMAQQKLDPRSDVTLVEIAASAGQLAAVKAGQADFATVNEPILSQGIRNGVWREPFISMPKALGPFAWTTLNVPLKLIKSDPALVRAMVDATKRGMAYTLDNPDKVEGFAKQEFPNLGEQDMRAMISRTVGNDMWSAGAAMPVEGWTSLSTIIHIGGMLDKNVPYAQVFTVLLGRVVTMNPDRAILADGAIAVRGGRIAAVGDRASMLADWAPAQSLAPPRAIIIPGLIDAHTHMAQTLVRGLIANELPYILRILQPVTLAMTPAEIATAATLCATQLLSSGVTTVCEGAIGMTDDKLAALLDAVQAVGIRCNIVVGRSDQTMHHAALYAQSRDRSSVTIREGEAEADLLRTEALLQRFPPSGPGRVTAGICASSLTGFSARYMQMADMLAERTGAKLHIHASRDREEVEFCLGVYGRRPIEQLAHLGVLSPQTVLAHAMLATEREMVLMGQAGCGVAHSPIECVNILNAVPNIRLMRELGVTVGLGGDNAANDMFRVMHGAWVAHGATRGIASYDPAVMPAEDILAMATIDAARLLGLDHAIGSIEVGKQADLVVLDGTDPHLFPVQALVPELVRYGSRGDVRSVMVAGQIVRDAAGVTTIDRAALARRCDRDGARLRAIAVGGRYRSLCC